MAYIKTGLERLLATPPSWIKGKRIGLLCNPASIHKSFKHSRFLIDQKFPGQLKALFSPQHGFFAEKQDNMIESGHIVDPVLKIPIFSLYGTTRQPEPDMYDLIDILIVDLQDVGTRVYTFIYTVSYCMEAARKYGKKMLVLDRPNPINGTMIEGNVLSPDLTSFVGRYPIPMRHGMTIGELCQMFNQYFKVECDLDVVPMEGWRRQMYFMDTGLPWVCPSPNLPTPVSAMVYPGQVLLEGTNISEGRGTTLPFEMFGAPYIDIESVLDQMNKGPKLAGFILRPVCFEPVANKHKGQPCKGFQIHITDPYVYQPFVTTVKLLQSIVKCHPDEFEWKNPPYEYEFEKMPIDLIIGSREVRSGIEKGSDLAKMVKDWTLALEEFISESSRFHLY